MIQKQIEIYNSIKKDNNGKEVFLRNRSCGNRCIGWLELSQNKNKVELSDLALENVEALARDEVGNIKCNRDIDVTCILVNNMPLKGERY